MANEKRFIRATSTKTLEVNAGLIGVNMTNKSAAVADRLRVAPQWVATRVLIKAGTRWYPALIKQWKCVQSLVRDGVLTFGESADVCDEEEAVETYNRVTRALTRYEETVKAAKADQAPKQDVSTAPVGAING